MTRLQRFSEKYKPFLLPIIILIIGVGVILYFTLYRKVPDQTIVAITALVFAVFQVVLNIVIQDKRNNAALRHTEYKELIKTLNAVDDLINEAASSQLYNLEIKELISNAKRLEVSVENKMREYDIFIKHNSTYLFKNIDKIPVILSMFLLFRDVITSTSNLVHNLSMIELTKDKMMPKDNRDLDLKSEWLDKLMQASSDYRKLKNQVLSEVQKYLR